MGIRRAVLIVAILALTFSSLAPAISAGAAAAPAAAMAPTSDSSGAGSLRLPQAPTASTPAAPPSPRSGLAQSILQRLRDAKISSKYAFLPNLAAQVHVSNGLVQPLYSVAPAPMGIGDFGVRNTTGTPSGYVLDSTSWEGTLSLNGASVLYMDDGVPDWFGAQLNTVLTNVTVFGTTTDTFWIQNVILYSTATHSLMFLDNIWNFSNPSTAEPVTTFYQGCPSQIGGPQGGVFYYCVGPSYTVPYPFTIHLFVNSSMTVDHTAHQEWSTVSFGYDLVTGAGAANGTYDTVLFNSSVSDTSGAPTPQFQVNGFQPNPVGLLNDAELMIGGPGGGSTTTVFAINGTEQLQYLSGGNYVNDPTAWNEGTDTGETVEGISEYYTAAGTVDLGPGPSIPTPFWNATPGGNIGEAVLQGTITPSNAFVWINQGSAFDPVQSAWAPVPPTGQYVWSMPPGSYFVGAEASEFDPAASILSLTPGDNLHDVALVADPFRGVYTPLWAWDNAQVANLSTSGSGTAADPYLLENNEYGSLDPLYAEVNDYFYPVFSGIFLAYTNAHVDINQPAPFYVTYPAQYAGGLAFFGYPNTNELAVQAYDASYVSIWQGSFTGWFPYVIFGFPIYAPVANVAFWGVTNSLVGDSTFTDQGSALLFALGTNNVVWGNTFLNGPALATFYAGQYPFGIQIIESGDLIYNNYVATTFPAYEWDANFYTGAPEVHRDRWNLSGAEPASQVSVVNGYGLTGSIVGSPWQCGNFWGNYAPGGPLPYDDPQIVLVNNVPAIIPFINTGGDYCPYPLPTFAVTFMETGLSSGTWSVSLGGIVQTAAAGGSITFQVPNGSWTWNVGAVPGRTVTPAAGTLTVAGSGQSVAITIGGAFAASMTKTPSAADAGQSVQFMATATGGSGAYTYVWSFGDGNYSNVANPTHAYPVAGLYTVNVWVNDTAGGRVVIGTTIAVSPALSVLASASPTSTDVNRAISFTATPSGGTGTVAYVWDFGDGSTSPSTGSSGAAHMFSLPGTYLVRVTATDAAGATDASTVAVTVAVAPSVTATASTNTPGAGSAVTFTASASGGTSPFSYAWTFGDGAMSTDQNPSHAYASPGTYTAHLWVNDSAGGSTTTTLTIVVTASNVIDSTTATAYTVVALIVGVLAGAGLTAVLRRRKPNPPQGGNPPTG